MIKSTKVIDTAQATGAKTLLEGHLIVVTDKQMPIGQLTLDRHGFGVLSTTAVEDAFTFNPDTGSLSYG